MNIQMRSVQVLSKFLHCNFLYFLCLHIGEPANTVCPSTHSPVGQTLCCPARSTLSFSSRTSLLEDAGSVDPPTRRHSQQSDAKQSNKLVLNAKLCLFGTSSWKTSSLQPLAACILQADLRLFYACAVQPRQLVTAQ